MRRGLLFGSCDCDADWVDCDLGYGCDRVVIQDIVRIRECYWGYGECHSGYMMVIRDIIRAIVIREIVVSTIVVSTIVVSTIVVSTIVVRNMVNATRMVLIVIGVGLRCKVGRWLQFSNVVRDMVTRVVVMGIY